MNKPDRSSELTSTLHLGVRSVIGNSPDSAISIYLAGLSESEKASVNSIINGDKDLAMVVIHRGPAKGARFLVDQEETTIGRSPESAIFLDDVTVSRKHALIKRNGRSFLIQDSGSLNGTYINNVALTSIDLKSGDEIQIGKYHAIFISAQK